MKIFQRGVPKQAALFYEQKIIFRLSGIFTGYPVEKIFCYQIQIQLKTFLYNLFWKVFLSRVGPTEVMGHGPKMDKPAAGGY